MNPKMWWMLALAACSEVSDVTPTELPVIADRLGWATAVPAEAVVVATLPAEVVSAPGGRAALGPDTTGRIASWRVAVGDTVRAGQTLATLISAERSSLGAQVGAERAVVAGRQALVDQARDALAAGVGSAVALRTAEASLHEAQSHLAVLERSVTARRRTTSDAGDEVAWTAPFAGVVAELACGLDLVTPSDRCLVLVDAALIRLEVAVPERHLAGLGSPVTAVFTGADGRETVFDEAGRSPELRTSTRAQVFRFAPVEPGVLPGSSGRAALSVAVEDAVVVPQVARTRLGEDDVVFVREGDAGVAVPVDVLGHHPGGLVVRGVPPGTEVAVRGVFLLKSLAVVEAP